MEKIPTKPKKLRLKRLQHSMACFHREALSRERAKVKQLLADAANEKNGPHTRAALYRAAGVKCEGIADLVERIASENE